MESAGEDRTSLERIRHELEARILEIYRAVRREGKLTLKKAEESGPAEAKKAIKFSNPAKKPEFRIPQSGYRVKIPEGIEPYKPLWEEYGIDDCLKTDVLCFAEDVYQLNLNGAFDAETIGSLVTLDDLAKFVKARIDETKQPGYMEKQHAKYFKDSAEALRAEKKQKKHPKNLGEIDPDYDGDYDEKARKKERKTRGKYRGYHHELSGKHYSS